jgi:hypothetical protein
LLVGTPAPAPSARSSAASATLGEGVQAPISQGRPAPHCSLLPLLPPTTSTPRSPEGRVPATRAVGILRSSVPDAPAAGSFAPSCAPLAPAPAVAPRARALRLGECAGWTARRSRPPSAGKNKASESRRRITEE